MNIFYLDPNPAICATYHCDRHVVKMILESAQLLCTAINVSAGEQVTPYKSTHVNHPCSIWVRESYENWSYVWQLMLALDKEWKFRYGHEKQHKSVEALINNNILNAAILYMGNTFSRFTSPALSMPDYCKVPNNPVESYRKYYREEKKHLHKWTNREIPFWINQGK